MNTSPSPSHPSVITAQARIVALENGCATLAAERRSACDSCTAAKGCSVPSLARALGDKTLTFQSADLSAPRIGDWYHIAIPQNAVLKLAAIAYLLPLTGLLALAVTASLFGAGDGGAVAASLAGLAIGHWSARRLAARPGISGLANPAIIGRATAATTDGTLCGTAD